MSKFGVFPGPYFPVFRLNTQIVRVNLPIQYEFGNIRTRKKSKFGHFSRNATFGIQSETSVSPAINVALDKAVLLRNTNIPG